MKYCILITDGAADYGLDEFNGQTALQAANTPYFDRMASEGEVGLTFNVPQGMEPSSAIACMSVMGYDPKEYYKGRASIEALSLGVPMEKGSSLFRCNFVNIQDGVMQSYNAGDIKSKEAAELIQALNEKLGSQQITFYPGLNYRHILKIKDGGLSLKAQTTAPHDISDKSILGYTPSGDNKDLLNFLMDASKEVLKNHPVNKARIKRGELPATQIWLFWGAPPLESCPSMQEKYGIKGAMSSAVSLLFGLGMMTGMDILHIDGVTDIDTNDYAAQIKGSLKSLDNHDMVVIHVEAPDEMGHIGQAKRKVQAISDIDKYMAKAIIDYAKSYDIRVLVLSDHPTPISLKTHTDEPVPYILWGKGIKASGAKRYTEDEATKSGIYEKNGYNMIKKLLMKRF